MLALPLAWWAWPDTDEVQPPLPAESPAPVAVVEPEVREPAPVPVIVPEDTVVDAGTPDAGPARALEPTAPQLEAYLKKWRDALAPLFRHTSQPVTAVLAEREPRMEPSDAGTPCRAGEHHLSFVKPVPLVDHVLVIDTSGSMFMAMRALPDFIGRLEYELAASGREYRILVLAESLQLQTTTAKSLSRRVESNDGLDVLLASAVTEDPHWLSMLRPDAEARLLLISDDDAKGLIAEPYLARLQALFGERRFTFSVMGGFGLPPARTLLDSSDAVSTTVCSDPGSRIRGVASGGVYQRLSKLTSGTRASLCSEASRRALVTRLMVDSRPAPVCEWALGEGARPFDVRALGQARTEYLSQETPASCGTMRYGYLLDGPKLTLCPTTCETFLREHLEEIQLRLDCR